MAYHLSFGKSFVSIAEIYAHVNRNAIPEKTKAFIRFDDPTKAFNKQSENVDVSQDTVLGAHPYISCFLLQFLVTVGDLELSYDLV